MAMPALPLDFASRRWTPGEVDALNDPGRAWPRYECVEGELLVTPAPNIDHQVVVGRLYRMPIDRLLLAIEVVSPGSAHADRVTKRRLNQRAGTPEYWVVDPDARVIERWRPDDARPEIVDGTFECHPEGATGPLTLDVALLLAE